MFLYAAVVFGVSLIGAAFILQRDLASNTKEKSPVPIVTEVSVEKEDVIQINEPLFTMALPVDWKQSNRVQASYANYYEWRSTKQGANDRTLRLHIDIMPSSYKLTRMLPLMIDGSKFLTGNVSGNCLNFATDTGENRSSNAPVEAKWENVTFVCDPISANQTIGTGTAENGIAAKVGRHTYFFYYEDHNIRPDDQILISAVRSFVAR